MSERYIHGYSPAEQARLSLMQSILNDAELGAFEVGDARRILDVGCGLGQFTRALAGVAGDRARVLGVELDDRQLAEARRLAEAEGESNVAEFRQGSAFDLPLADDERGAFDLAHCRFVLEHVRDPLGVVRQMCSALRRGGRLVLVDDDHELLRLWPACAPFERAWTIYWNSYADDGHDGLVGRRMAQLLVDAGARPRRVTSVFYGAVRGQPLFDPVVDNLAGVLEGAVEHLVQHGRMSAMAMDEALDELATWREHPAATLWYSLPLVEGEWPG